MDLPLRIEWLEASDRSEKTLERDILLVDYLLESAQKGEKVSISFGIYIFGVERFLSKLALGIGFNVFGWDFFNDKYSHLLRSLFREADRSKRDLIRNQVGLGFAMGPSTLKKNFPSVLKWDGAWVLMLLFDEQSEFLSVGIIDPLGNIHSVIVTKSTYLISILSAQYRENQVWIVVPTLGRAVGPISLTQLEQCARDRA